MYKNYSTTNQSLVTALSPTDSWGTELSLTRQEIQGNSLLQISAGTSNLRSLWTCWLCLCTTKDIVNPQLERLANQHCSRHRSANVGQHYIETTPPWGPSWGLYVLLRIRLALLGEQQAESLHLIKIQTSKALSQNILSDNLTRLKAIAWPAEQHLLKATEDITTSANKANFIRVNPTSGNKANSANRQEKQLTFHFFSLRLTRNFDSEASSPKNSVQEKRSRTLVPTGVAWETCNPHGVLVKRTKFLKTAANDAILLNDCTRTAVPSCSIVSGLAGLQTSLVFSVCYSGSITSKLLHSVVWLKLKYLCVLKIVEYFVAMNLWCPSQLCCVWHN